MHTSYLVVAMMWQKVFVRLKDQLAKDHLSDHRRVGGGASKGGGVLRVGWLFHDVLVLTVQPLLATRAGEVCGADSDT
jgi:hypothetical protein